MFKGVILSVLLIGTSVPQIRVLIASGKTVEIKGDVIEILDPYTYSEIGLFSGNLKLYLTSAGIVVGKNPTLKDYLIIKGKGIEIDKKAYPGRIEAIARDNTIYLINDLDLENYVKGVVASEVPNSWNVEALKAQSVAARTYAYNLIRERRNELYDLSATVLHQVYSGIEHTTPKVILAVESTRGEVLFYDGEIIKPYYHSDCGGKTDSSEKIWGIPLPYLQPVRCPFPGKRWKATFTAQSLGRKVGLKSVKYIKVIERSPSGRILKIKLGDGEKTITLSGEDMRRILGYSELKSAIFDVSIANDRIVFEGKGSGHGVGMCQWGAQKLAEKGYNYREILKFYYKGVEIRKLY